MKTFVEYVISVNGNPFFAVTNPFRVPMVIEEAKSRFGSDCRVRIRKHIYEPYDPNSAVDDCK